MNFTSQLHRACEMRGLTNQRELAELARVSKSSLNRWLQGTSYPDISEASRLANVLEVSLDWLVGNENELDLPQLSDVEQIAVDLVRALDISKTEVIRRLVGRSAKRRFEEDQHGAILEDGTSINFDGWIAKESNRAEMIELLLHKSLADFNPADWRVRDLLYFDSCINEMINSIDNLEAQKDSVLLRNKEFVRKALMKVGPTQADRLAAQLEEDRQTDRLISQLEEEKSRRATMDSKSSKPKKPSPKK